MIVLQYFCYISISNYFIPELNAVDNASTTVDNPSTIHLQLWIAVDNLWMAVDNLWMAVDDVVILCKSTVHTVDKLTLILTFQ